MIFSLWSIIQVLIKNPRDTSLGNIGSWSHDVYVFFVMKFQPYDLSDVKDFV